MHSKKQELGEANQDTQPSDVGCQGCKGLTKYAMDRPHIRSRTEEQGMPVSRICILAMGHVC
jgi:hypothetical protein